MKSIMSKLLVFLAIPVIISGCGTTTTPGGTTTGGSAPAGFSSYDGSSFTINVPTDWEIIDSKSFTSNVPAEIVVGFRNNIKNEIFTSNVNVAQTNLPKEVTSEDFGKSSLLKTKETLVGFKELSKEDYTFKYNNSDVATFISGFEGKKTPSDPILNFKQLYVVNNGVGYTITAGYLPYEDAGVVKSMDEMLHSFSLK